MRSVFCKYFFPICGFSVILLMLSFTGQKFLVLIKSNLPFFFLIRIVSLLLFVESYCHTKSHLGFLCYLLKMSYFGVLHLGPVILFKLFFCEGHKICIWIHFLNENCPVVPEPFAEKIILLLYFYSFVKNQLTIFV